MVRLTSIKRVYDRMCGFFSFTLGCVGLFVS